MAGKNRGICHSCRQAGHRLPECPNKQRCPKCSEGIVKLMEVEKKTKNVGRLFQCCTNNCGYFDWKKEAMETEGYCKDICGGSQSTVMCSSENQDTAPIQDLSHMFKSLAALKIEEDDVEISFSLTIRKGNGKSEDKGKGKGKRKRME